MKNNRTFIAMFFLLVIGIITSCQHLNGSTPSGDQSKITKYKQVSIKCNKDQLPDRCTSKSGTIEVVFSNTLETTNIQIKNSSISKIFDLGFFFEGLDYNVLLFENGNEKILLLDLVYEYSNDFIVFKIAKNNGIVKLGSFKYQAAENDLDNKAIEIAEGDNKIIISVNDQETIFDVQQNQALKRDIDVYSSDNNYFIKSIDVNKDGAEDKVISSVKYQGNELVIYLANGGEFDLAFKGNNLSEDGGNQIFDIKNSKRGFEIITSFSGKGVNEKKFKIAYVRDEFIVDTLISKTSQWQESLDRIEVCKIPLNINLKDYALVQNKNRLKSSSYCAYHYTFNQSTLEGFIKDIKGKELSYKDEQRYHELLQKFPLQNSNITSYNNLAFYLEQAGNNKEAVLLLKKVLEKDPERIVAYLNLGDAYWKINEKENARDAYVNYRRLIMKKGLENKIPKRVTQRVN